MKTDAIDYCIAHVYVHAFMDFQIKKCKDAREQLAALIDNQIKCRCKDCMRWKNSCTGCGDFGNGESYCSDSEEKQKEGVKCTI